MENKDYIMSSLDEYFEILDRENKKRSELVAKSLVKYLQKSKEANKFEAIQIAKWGQGKYFGEKGKSKLIEVCKSRPLVFGKIHQINKFDV